MFDYLEGHDCIGALIRERKRSLLEVDPYEFHTVRQSIPMYDIRGYVLLEPGPNNWP